MRVYRKILKSLIVSIICIEIGLAYAAYEILSGNSLMDTAFIEIEAMTIKNEKRSIVKSGQVKTKESHTEYYKIGEYGRYRSTSVSVGQLVREGDVIVEAETKLYRAPFTGYIVELNPEEAYNQARRAQANGTTVAEPIPLYTMVSDDVYIESELTEYEISRLPEHQAIKYTIRAGDKNKAHDASIRLLSSVPKNNLPISVKKPDIADYKLTLNMDSGKENVRVGNHVTIQIHDTAPPTFLIPLNAVVRDNNKTYVYVIEKVFKDMVEQDGAFVTREKAVLRRKEVVGAQFNGKFRVQSGLIVGDQIATKNVLSLQDRMTVVLARNGEKSVA